MTKLSAGDTCNVKFGTTIEARDRFHAACAAYGSTMAAMLRHFIVDWTLQIEAWIKERDGEESK